MPPMTSPFAQPALPADAAGAVPPALGMRALSAGSVGGEGFGGSALQVLPSS
jgi:hypothetical protein